MAIRRQFDSELEAEIDFYFSHKLGSDPSIGVGYALFSAGDYFTAIKAPAGTHQPDVDFAWISTDIKLQE